jgi:ribosomal protein S19
MKKASYINPSFYRAIIKIKNSPVQNTQPTPVQPSFKVWGKKKKPLNLRPNLFKSLNKTLTVYCRNTILLPYSLGFTFIIHNGLVYLKILVAENIIGHKLGEFSQTRKRYFYKNRKNKKKRRR